MTFQRQAVALQRLTGLPAALCRRALRIACRRPAPPQRLHQMDLFNQPCTPDEVAAGFAKCREILTRKSQ